MDGKIILILILTIAPSCNAFKFNLPEYPGIRVCRVREKDCAFEPDQRYYLRYLRGIYGGCTHILGNLVLCNLERYENGSDPDLSFLSSIQEVSGYVYLSRNSVKTIPLPSLRVIRGEPPFDFKGINASFIATRNGINMTHALEVIDMRNLTAIKQHNVVLRNNPLLCHLAFTVLWEEIFMDKNTQGAVPDRETDVISQIGCDPTFREPTKVRIREKCHGQCALQQEQGFCWGPGPDSCQKLVKCSNGEDQYCQDGPSTRIPCNQECLGGCDHSPNNCRACMFTRDGDKCVSQCPPKEIVSRVDSRSQPNPNFKYTFHDICVKDCPAPFLKSNIHCVIECDLSSQIPVNGTCQQCPGSVCPEHCTADQIFDKKPYIVDDRALDRIKNCIYYTGSIYISKESFNPSSSWKPITDISKLWNLRSIKGMVGYIYMDLSGAPAELKNLTFLDNLETLVWETGKIQIPMITIMNGEHIEMLGFRSLKAVKSPVHLVNMTKLCYTSALTSSIAVRMKNVPTEQECAQRDAVCHSECLPDAGCWGPTADMCAHCCNRKAGDYCVSECTDRPGYYELRQSQSAAPKHQTGSGYCITMPGVKSFGYHVDEIAERPARLPTQECRKCHEECAKTCYGPGPHECQGGCKNYQHQDTCVTRCPSETYVESGTNQCLPCHPTCLHSIISTETRLCSGPGDHFGLGGCTACLTVQKNKTTQQFQCLSRDCPLKHYIESHTLTDFIRKEKLVVSRETEEVAASKFSGSFMLRVCKPCHPYCDVCTANGTHSSICHSCVHWWFKSECVLQCPPGETYDPQQISTSSSASALTTPSTDKSNSNLESELPTSTVGKQQKQRRDSVIRPANMGNITSTRQLLGSNQQYCLLCHDECVQGCTGPGPKDCVKCKNYKIILDEVGDEFICNTSCPDDRPHVLLGMCLTAEQYAKYSGRAARERRDRIVIGVSVAILLLVIVAAIILIVCLKRKSDDAQKQKKLHAAYTNLLETEKDERMKNQSTIREPNMARLEMINVDDLEFDQSTGPLGSGAFGVVYRGTWRVPKAALLKYGCSGTARLDVAIKVIQNDDPISPGILNQAQSFPIGSETCDVDAEAKRAAARSNLEELLQEAKVMASVEHRHCLPLIGICLSRERHCLVSAFVAEGSLDKYVQNNKDTLNSLTMLSWAAQIADGMSYLEMRGIIHRDLAARNVLVQRHDLVQITDFGLAKMLERKDEDRVVVRAGRVPIRWLAIETLQESIYSHKTDVWTYGVTLWEIFTYGRRPYEDVETKNIKDHVMKGGRLTQPEICTLDVYMVMVKCWMEDYESRPTFAELTRTFNNFCKTPGRYLYIQGDEYAINHHTSTYCAPTNLSAESHELQPLINRGMPDGSAYATKLNGSQCHTTLSDVSSGTLHANGPHRFPRSSNPFEYPQPSIGVRSDQFPFEEPMGPDGSEALLPTRTNPPSHGLWSMRGWTAVVNPGPVTGTSPHGGTMTAPVDGTHSHPGSTGPMSPGSVSPRYPGRSTAPLATREDSWIAEAPDSPAWHPPIKNDPRTMTRCSPGKKVFRNPDGSVVRPVAGGSTLFPTAWNRTGDMTGPLPPAPHPATLEEDYLQPRSNPVIPAAHNLAQVDQRKTEPAKPATSTSIGEDYLVPKSRSEVGDTPAVTDFGISNMEYFMQPYFDPSGTEYLEGERTTADGSDNKSSAFTSTVNPTQV